GVAHLRLEALIVARPVSAAILRVTAFALAAAPVAASATASATPPAAIAVAVSAWLARLALRAFVELSAFALAVVAGVFRRGGLLAIAFVREACVLLEARGALLAVVAIASAASAAASPPSAPLPVFAMGIGSFLRRTLGLAFRLQSALALLFVFRLFLDNV